jgi:hypothetical protein
LSCCISRNFFTKFLRGITNFAAQSRANPKCYSESLQTETAAQIFSGKIMKREQYSVGSCGARLLRRACAAVFERGVSWTSNGGGLG